MKTYYTVIGRETKESKWFVLFGAYDYDDAKDEMIIERETGDYANIGVITTDHNQSAIDARLNQLNGAIA